MENKLVIPEKIQKIIDQYKDNMDEAPLYSSRGLNVYIELIKANYHYIDIDELLAHAHMTMAEMKDPGHWFNQKQINAFMEYLTTNTGCQDIAREAGRFACAPEALGILRSYYRAFGHPLFAFKQLGKLASDVSLSSKYKSIVHSSNQIEIIVTPYPGVKEENYQCDNRQGYFEGIFQVFDMPLPEIKHDHCIKNGQKKCIYIISWKPVKSEQYKRYHNYFMLFCFSLILVLLLIASSLNTMKIILIMLVVNIIAKLLINHWEIAELRKLVVQKTETESTPFSQLFEKIQDNYQNHLMIRKLSEALSKSYQLNEAIEKVLDLLKSRYGRCAILLANHNKSKLIYKAGYGYTEDQLYLWQRTGWFHVLPESEGTFIRSFREKVPFLINDIKDVLDNYSMRSIEFVGKMNVTSLLCCPIFFEKQSFGVIAVANHSDDRELIQSDMNLLMGIAHQIAVIIQLNKNVGNERNAAMVDMAIQAVHNIKNPAFGIANNLRYIKKHSTLDEKSSKKLQDSLFFNTQILDLSKDFLNFLRPIELRKEDVYINDFIKEIIEHNKIDQNNFKLTLAASNPSIQLDKNAIESVLEELIENSKKYGKFPIEIKITAYEQLIHILFMDQGKAITEEIREDIFKPGFSGDKQGTGLGLANIVRIIDEHNGSIRLSEEVSNTCFIIHLPT